MPDPSQLANSAAYLPAARVFEATVARDVEAEGDEAWVTIEEFGDDGYLHGPAPWSPVVRAAGTYYPHAGDPCVVAVPIEGGTPWIISWEVSAPVDVGSAAAAIEPGKLDFFLWDDPPSASWVAADGSAYTTDDPLRDKLISEGNPFGVSGSDPLLPNVKGRTIYIKDSGQTEFDTIGETGGSKTHTLTAAEMPSHTHSDGTLAVASHSHGVGTLAVASHSHTDGTLSVDSHTHGVGTLAVASHSHTDGTLAVASHPHGDGTLAVASHSHSDGTLTVAAHNHGVTDPGHTHGLNSINGTHAAGGTARVTGSGVTVNTGSNTTGITTQNASPDVTGDTGSTAPDVTGSTASASPDVTGDTGSTAPSLSGSTAAATPDVTGSTGSTAPGLSGSTGTDAPDVTGATGSAGTGDAHNNLSPYIVLNAFITTGV